MSLKICTLLAGMFFVMGISAQERLFNFDGIRKAPASEIVIKYTKLKLDRTVLEDLYVRRPGTVRIAIPIEHETIIVNLKKADLFAKNFQAIEANSLEVSNFIPGYYLQGTVEGEAHSVVALSIFSDVMGGIISYKGNTYNLAVGNNNNDHQSNDYVIYADKDFLAPRPKCFTADDAAPITVPANSSRTTYAGCPVDVYFETGYKIFESQGSIQNVMNYLTILFNFEQVLYDNESILIQMREVKVWNTVDPEYLLTATSPVLNSFSARMASGFNGDIAHYVTFSTLGGGVAWLDELCNSNTFYKTGISGNLSSNYSAFPNYSFSVVVITHEMGHNIGSRHTHNCMWPGGAIDNCYTTEGGCPPGPAPVNGGTIMSYCHTVFSVGINFANGFGPLPGNLVRAKVTSATSAGCICDCASIQMDVTKQDIGCGNPTGSATALVTGGIGPFTYAWSNGATGSSVTGLAAGTYFVTVTGTGANCTVVKGFKILNAGNSTVVSLSPNSTTVSKCLNDNYTLTSSEIPVGSYTYQWYQNGVAYPGATTNSINITSAVANTSTYYVVATSAGCSGQSPTVTIAFQPVTVPVISPAGPVNTCENQSVILSVPASGFSVEWRINGTLIPGATSTTYTTASAGSYTVRNFSPTNASCSAMSAPVIVAIKPSPDATTNPATLEFCSGGQQVISHAGTPGETYAWYNNNTLIPGASASTLNVLASGDYYIKVTGINGCENTSSSTVVSVDPLPDAGLTPAGTVSLCDGGRLTLQVPSTSQMRYTWYNGSQQIALTATNIIQVTHGGSFTVHIENTVTGCENTSLPVIVVLTPPPAVFAGNDTVIAIGQPYVLHAQTTSPIAADHFEWTPITGLDDPLTGDPTATLTHDQEYTVRGIYPSGCSATDKILIKVMRGPAIYIPSAFTPNGDNKNDVLRCTVVGMQSFGYFDIFNRYGNRVFHTTDLSIGWDGKFNGKLMGPGSYVFVAEGVDYSGKKVVRRGTVTVVD